MGVFRFPFNWGVETPVVPVVPPVVVPPSGTRWTAITCPSPGWIEGVATPRRFERIYARPTSTFGQSVNFSYEIRSQFPFILANTAQVVITSTITNP